MTRLTVELDDFVAAARTMHDDVGEPVRRANARLGDTLAGCGSMAGDDEGGRSWATAYDDAAESVVIATHRVAAAAFQTSTLFGHSASNYARAEAASTTSGPGSPAHLVQGLPPTGTAGRVAAPPSAAGGGGDEPTGWGVVKSLVGYVWPNGHQDRLRRSANAYRNCANVLESVAIEPATVSIRFLSDRLPEADDVNTVCGGLAERIRSLSDAHRTLARSCDDLADHIDHCHSEVESELSSLAIESGALQAAGAVASVFTLGAAEVPTQVAQAARIAAVAAKVAEIIRRFVAAARVLDAAIPPVAHAALGITQALDKLANARTRTANVTTVPRLDRQNMVAGRGETAATGRLAETPPWLRRPPLLPHVGDAKRFDPKVLRGLKPAEIGKRIPSSWKRSRAVRDQGIVYSDPRNRGRQIRIMRGYPPYSRPERMTWGPYAVIAQNGNKIKVPLEGNPTL